MTETSLRDISARPVCVYLFSSPGRRTPLETTQSHSPHGGECDGMSGALRVQAAREKRYTQNFRTLRSTTPRAVHPVCCPLYGRQCVPKAFHSARHPTGHLSNAWLLRALRFWQAVHCTSCHRHCGADDMRLDGASEMYVTKVERRLPAPTMMVSYHT